MVASGDIFILITHIVLSVIHFSYREPLHTNMYIVSMFAGADPGGAPGAQAPPLTLGFEAPKLSIFGPYLIFP